MKYYSEDTVKGLLEQMDSHFVKYLDNLPSIEVKEPHGRCIDADFAITQEKNYYCKDCNNWNGIRCKTCEHDWIMMVLDDAPTVIEASKERE